jgi:hypothetical protein
MKEALFPGVSLLILSIATPAFSVGKGKAVYVGGTIGGIKEKTEAAINLKDDTALQYGGGLTIPWAGVQEIEYGQKVGHRIGQAILLSPLVLFKKSRHHYVTVNYKDAADKEQAVVFEFDKDDITPFGCRTRPLPPFPGGLGEDRRRARARGDDSGGALRGSPGVTLGATVSCAC